MDQELRDKAVALQNSMRWSNADMARFTGISRTYWSRYKEGQYEHDDGKIEALLRSKLKSVEGLDVGFLPLESSDIIMEVCQRVHRNNDIALLIGPTGCGKTFALRNYHMLAAGMGYGKTCLVTIDALHSHFGFLYELAAGIGTNRSGGAAKMQSDIIGYLASNPRLLLVDEANNLNIAQLNALREIHDKSGCGLVLAGTPELYTTIKLNRQMAMLHNRIGIFKILPELSDEEIGMVLGKCFETETVERDVHQAVFASCGRNVRLLYKLLQNLRERVNLARTRITPQLIRNAAAELISVEIDNRLATAFPKITTGKPVSTTQPMPLEKGA
jgi:DNA transposition AAA+ family ATPase